MAYVMKCRRADGREHESRAEVAEYDEATESRLVLYGIREALQRLRYSCEVVVHTECAYVAGAIAQGWPEAWERGHWKNRKGEAVKDSVLWSQILQEVTEQGHQLKAEAGKHEYANWLRYKMHLAPGHKEVFWQIPD
ncbi:MAG: hypothetical protein NC432_08680 [Roseburia sp.]|nr:hypothetical protein [Roseburia sp.]MCM1097812.1 hypothetical protein [Ruminococcus flavefaciens]